MRLLHLRKPAVLLAACLAATGAGGAISSPAGAGEGPRPHFVCDSSGCLIASLVLADSDGDGATDSDERAAGTDPHDPTSHPPLTTLVDLAALGELPSFASVASQFLVFPSYDKAFGVDLQLAAEMEMMSLDPTGGAFAPPVRGDALTRLGVTPEHAAQVTAHGTQTLLVQLPAPSEKKGTRPAGAKISYLELVSQDGGTGGKKVDHHVTLKDGTTIDFMTEWNDKGTEIVGSEETWKKDGEIIRHCKNGVCDIGLTDPDATNVDTSAPIDPITADLALARLGSTKKPVRVGGIGPFTGEDAAAAVEKKCLAAAGDGDVVDVGGGEDAGSKGPVRDCGGVVLVDDLAGGGIGSFSLTTPDLFNKAQPRTVPGFQPIILADPTQQGGGGGSGDGPWGEGAGLGTGG